MLKLTLQLPVLLCLVLISSVTYSKGDSDELVAISSDPSFSSPQTLTLTYRDDERILNENANLADTAVVTVNDSRTAEFTNSFIVPNPISNIADSFIDGNKEYIIVQGSVQHYQAILTCKQKYDGTLAIISDASAAYFLAEALSETNLDLNSLWLGAEKTPKGWSWISNTNAEQFDTKLFDRLLSQNPHIKEDASPGRQCLAFGRSDHSDPQFRVLNCAAHRSFICQKEAKLESYSDNSTHPGWIKIGKRSFKIFHNQISWENASVQCARHHANASLAVITSFKETQVLGRYLLIGRPSLENAWIGARYNIDFQSYYYYSIDLKLPNTTTSQGFPRWKSSTVGKHKGCVLLDRHVSNSTVFMEARCDRHRSYICSIETPPSKKEILFSDVIVGEKGYRLIYKEQSWDDALLFCHKTYEKYASYLVVIYSYIENFNLLYLMGENRSDVQHIWIGGKYVQGKWQWIPTGKYIESSTINLVENYTYSDEVEGGNLCLNMDRENHMTPFHYGADCSWPQPFVCGFDAENLQKLQNDESKEIIIDM